MTKTEPTLAYNSNLDEYLVLWRDYRNGGNADIYGQIVGSDGTLGATVDMSGLSTKTHQEAALVYNPDQARYQDEWRFRGCPVGESPECDGRIIIENADDYASQSVFVVFYSEVDVSTISTFYVDAVKLSACTN